MAHKSIEKVAVVVPNLNGETYLAEAIDSLLRQTLKAMIIVVENASTDRSLTILESYGDKIIILKNKKNLGFAGGVNIGIKYALERDFAAVALFNNDAVAQPEWLLELVGTMSSDKNIGIVTSKITLSGRHLLDSTGEFYTTWGLPYPRGRGKAIDLYTKKEAVFGASGGASLYRAELFDDIGLFDDTFFAYYEDTDISFRAQLAGWKVFYNPDAVVTHRQGATSKKMVHGFTTYQTFKNLPMLFWKNIPLELIAPIGIRFCIAYTLIFGKALFSSNALAAIKGVLMFIAFIPHTISERRKIQKSKKVSASHIKSIIITDLPPDQTGLRKLRKVFIGR